MPPSRAITPGLTRCYALLPCAGSGSRAGSETPKQYRPLAGRPLVEHTLAAIRQVSRIELCLVVTAPGDRILADPGAWYRVADCGGATRARSVLAGLRRLVYLGMRPGDWVLVHDAARCLLTPAMVDTLIDACFDDPVGGLLATPLADTLKVAREDTDGPRVAATLERSHKWLAQTPQMFRAGLLQQALEAAGDAVTDEASAVEAMGHAPRLVRGSLRNIKVTWPEDFALAEALLKGSP